MPNTDLSTRAHQAVCEALERIEGVRRAVIEGPPYRAYLVCDPGAAPSAALEAAARSALAREDAGLAAAELEFLYSSTPQAARRVRFVELELRRPRVGVASAVATLEWGDQLFHGEAEGEGGSPGELRVSAHATQRALEAVLAGSVQLQLVGVKALRIFDNDLVAVLLSSAQAPGRRLMGVSLVVNEDVHRSAALAVLNATNRHLGNYLGTAD